MTKYIKNVIIDFKLYKKNIIFATRRNIDNEGKTCIAQHPLHNRYVLCKYNTINNTISTEIMCRYRSLKENEKKHLKISISLEMSDKYCNKKILYKAKKCKHVRIIDNNIKLNCFVFSL